MPIVTQSRTIPGSKMVGKAIQPGGYVETLNDTAQSGWQNTTSYRSNLTGEYRRSGQQESDVYGDESLRRAAANQHHYRYDNGHNFATEKYWMEYAFDGAFSNGTGLSFHFRDNSGRISEYRGYLYPPVVGDMFANLVPPSGTQVRLDGTAAINSTIPTAPEAGLTQFLGELKEGIPKLTGTIALKKGLNGKNISEEYLNREFGQKPFINDLTKFVNSMLSANKLVSQYRRDSGRNVRRRRVLREESSTNVVAEAQAVYPNPVVVFGSTLMFDRIPGCRVVDTFYNKVSFSGAYTYHMAEMDSLLGNLERYEQQANHLLGTRITPSTIWELTPWSWLIDWYSNFGQIVQNISLLSQDSTVLRYGYVMHENHAIRTRMMSGLRSSSGVELPPVFTEAKAVSKKRTRATPYGFGIDVSNLSPRRWAILAALGMTKGSNSLRLSD